MMNNEDLIKLANRLEEFWVEQKLYNTDIRNENDFSIDHPVTYWSKQYLLGLVSEIDEVLREINWKRHRKRQGVALSRENLALELSDLTKYVMSLWQLYDFSLWEMLDWINIKSYIMRTQWEMERAKPEPEQLIVICDIDGTLADWRWSFIQWLNNHYGYSLKEGDDPETTLLMDQDLHVPYTEYNRLKEEFENTGGYLTLQPYLDAVQAVRLLKAHGAFLVVFTARPTDRSKIIWWDTYQWLKSNFVIPHILEIGNENRILYGADLLKAGHKVVLFDDNPGNILRAANSGIKVWVKPKKYNQAIYHPNVCSTGDYYQVARKILNLDGDRRLPDDPN